MRILPLLLMICCLPRDGHPQSTAPIPASNNGLPDAPRAKSSLSGIVLDVNGAALAGAKVTLAGDPEHSVLSDDDGKFVFGGLPAGSHRLTITSPAMEPFVRSDIVLVGGESVELPPVVMVIAGITTEVHVNVSQTELAQEQITAAEHQRVLGILPNFYSSYLWDAEPLNAKQKFSLAFHSITDPVEFLGTAIVAGAEQANNTFAGYGQGFQGYAKRYGSGYADDVSARMIGSAILPSLLHQDPRYFYKGTGSVRSRIYYAVSRAVVTRGDNGKAQPNYSHVLGSFAAGGISNLYHPAADRGVGLTLGNGLIETAASAADNLVREFLLRKLTPNVPQYARGKP
jgi:hypothetical protein